MSRFDVLSKRGASTAAAVDDAQKPVARRGNPDYRQFSAYIPVEMYRRLKVRLAESETDLSVGVEEAIADWLSKPTRRTSSPSPSSTAPA